MTNTVVSNGVISSGLTLQSGDTLSVLAGGTIHDITVSGGQIGLAGVSTSNVTIYAGATEVVFIWRCRIGSFRVRHKSIRRDPKHIVGRRLSVLDGIIVAVSRA